MKDMNIAKLTSVDLPLFNGIMADLFPGIETPVIDYSKVIFTNQSAANTWFHHKRTFLFFIPLTESHLYIDWTLWLDPETI